MMFHTRFWKVWKYYEVKMHFKSASFSSLRANSPIWARERASAPRSRVPLVRLLFTISSNGELARRPGSQAIRFLQIKAKIKIVHLTLESNSSLCNQINLYKIASFCTSFYKAFTDAWSNISSMIMKRSVSLPDETLRRELKKRHAAEYFWRTSGFLVCWWKTVSSKRM